MPQRKILIVEDDFILYDELSEFFEEKGFAIVKNENEAAVDNYDDAIQLVKLHKPDIAILDIFLGKGKKDGIDIGAFIKQHYRIPVIYLSAYPNPENLERIRKNGDERFMFKASKPLNKEQLWSLFYLALPEADMKVKEKTMGRFFSVKEIPLNGAAKYKAPPPYKDPVEVQSFFKWDDIIFIESYNKIINNSALLHTLQSDKGYVLRGSLDYLESELPEYFVRFNQNQLINFRKVTGRVKGGTTYFIGGNDYKITDTYKTKALEKIARLTGEGELNIPET